MRRRARQAARHCASLSAREGRNFITLPFHAISAKFRPMEPKSRREERVILIVLVAMTALVGVFLAAVAIIGKGIAE